MTILNLLDNSLFQGTRINLAVTQGKTYQLSIEYPANLTIGTLRGQIRTKYIQDEGELLANFQFTINYNSTDNSSNILIFIPALITATIPYTVYQNRPNQELTLNNSYVYDIEYEENSTIIELLRGQVQVIPEVTL